MTDLTLAAVRAFLAASDRPPGKCLGTVGNDLTGHFGAYPVLYYSAKVAADSLGQDLHTTDCPADSHFDFYDYVEGGVNYGHIDLHIGALHYANSSRCTTWLNAHRTVGTYPSWGTRRGWSYHPGAGNTLPTVTTPTPTPPTPPTPPHPAAITLPTRAQWLAIQRGLRRRGRYAGPLDGVPGVNTWRGVQLTARAGGGYLGPIDGAPGVNTWRGVQTYARNWGGYAGPIDGVPGPATWAAFVKGVK